jgi:filamentous hemagglutinin family protein
VNANSFKVIFSKRLGTFVAVGEHASAQGKSARGEGARGAALAAVVFLAGLTSAYALDPSALPSGPTAVAGAAAIAVNGPRMDITQSTDRAAINWQSFNVGSGASVHIAQPSASSVLLNRVVGNEMSQIRGQISANGQVVLVNPNGIVMGPTGRITASAFTASSFDIADADFQAGHMRFQRSAHSGAVVNQGSIESTDAGGYVALIGADVSNQGTITTRQGAVVLAAADAVVIPATPGFDENKVSVPLSSNVRLELNPDSFGSANVSNSGVIVTDGGQVLMRAAAVVDAVSKIANANIVQSGSIDTSGAQGGAVNILADNGRIRVSGSVKANSRNGTAGGDIYIGRDKATKILAAIGDASGARLESQGGFVETSGQFLATFGTRVTAKDWLLDPVNITISGGTTTPSSPIWAAGSTQTGSVILAGDIAANLNAGTNVKISTGVEDQAGDSGDQDGNIFVNAAIEKTGANNATLTLEANNRIIINARIGRRAAPAAGDTGHLNVNIDARGNKGTEAQGVVVMRNVIDAGTGLVNISATSKTGWEGLFFDGTTGITAGTYTVRGTSTSTAVRFNSGTATFNSSLGNSSIEGTGGGFGGVFASSGNTINLNTTESATTTLASGVNSTAGMRFGFGGGVTVNTNGNVTIGSHHNSSGLFIQANVNVNGGHLTLKGKSSGNGIGLQDGSGTPARINVNNGSTLTMDGISTTSGNGIDLRPQGAANFITMTSTNAGQRGTINLIGESSTGAGIYTSFATITSDGGNINLTGTSQGNAIVHDGLIRSGDASSGGVVTFTGTSTGSATPRLGINSSGSVQGGSVVFNGKSEGVQGVYTAGAVTAVAGNVSMTGTSAQGTGVHTQGLVRASDNITLNGTSSNSQGVIIQNSVESTAGDISVTGVTSVTNQRAVSLTANGSIFGALTVANGRSISVAADTLLINTGSTLNAGTTGTVNLQTTTNSVAIALGAEDVMSGTRVLGLSQAELNRITAGQLNIGKTAHNGMVTVSSAITTNASTGNIALQTGGNIAVNQALTVGDAAGTKNLTLDAGGAITSGANGKLTAKDLTLKAGSTIGSSTQAIKTSVVNASLTSSGSQFLVEDNAVKVAAKTSGGGSIDITTTNGTMTVGTVNGVSGIDAGVGNVNLKATTSTDHGLVLQNGALVKGQDITMDATSNTTGGLGFFGQGGSFDAAGVLKLKGEATGTGNGLYTFGGEFKAGTGIEITGTSANGQGVGFDRNAKLINTTGDILIKGTARDLSEANNGVSAANTQGIGLRGVSIDNAGGKITLEAVKGQIFADTGNKLWGGGYPFTNTITQNGTGDVKLTTVGNGNIHVPLIVNNGAGNVIVAAGSNIAAGTGTGGQVRTVSGNTITQNSTGRTFIYTGQASGTGQLSHLSDAFTQLVYQGSSLPLNAKFNTTLGGSTIDGATAQVLFRETAAPSFTMTLNDISKTYGDADPTLAARNTALLNAYNVSSTLPSTLTTSVDGANSGSNTFAVKAADVINGLTGTNRAAGSNVGSYAYTDISASAFNTTLSAKPKLVINQREITLIGTSVADKAFDGTTEAQLVNPGQLDGLVNNEQLGLSATATFGDANVGNAKPVSIQASLQDSNTGMASNYRLIVPTGITASITGAVEPTPTPAPIVPVVPSNANTNSVSFAAANNNFQLAGAEGECSADTLELCECEGGPDIQICYEPSKAP